jgi:hypothetical protein
MHRVPVMSHMNRDPAPDASHPFPAGLSPREMAPCA